MFSIKEERNTSYVVLWPFKFVLTSVKFQMSGWTIACQTPLSMGFSRQDYWSGLRCPSTGDLPNPGIESVSLMSPGLAGGFFITSAPRKPRELKFKF